MSKEVKEELFKFRKEDEKGKTIKVQLYADNNTLLICGTKATNVNQGDDLERTSNKLLYKVITPVIERNEMFYFALYLHPRKDK